MKITKLLVSSVLWLTASSAMAAVPDGVWTIPEPQGLEFTDVVYDEGSTHFYLYNPVAKMFFASGNDWNTRASIAGFGYEVWFQESTEVDAPEGSYEFWDDCQHPDRVLGYKNMFTDDGGSTWVDHAAQANYSWSVTKVGDSYRIQNVALVADFPDFDGKYIGWKGDYTDTRLYMLAEGEGAIDWKFVTYDSYQAFKESDAYTAYKNGVDCYSVAMSLKTVLEEGEAIKADIAEPLAVYNNTASTKAQLEAAITAAKAAIEKRKAELVDDQYGNASVTNPVEVTDKFIKNPHFDNGDATTGWSGDSFGRGGTVSDGAEHYSKNYDTYQTITGLTPGIYAVGVNAYYRSGNYGGDAENHYVANDDASKYAKLYAKVGETTYETPIANVMSGGQAEAQNQGDMAVTYQDAEGNEVTVYVPNTMATGDYFFHTLNQYANKLYVAVGEAGELTIGVKKTSMISGDWSMFDDFSLTYYGAGADACQLFMDEAMKNFSDVEIEEDVVYTEQYLTDYREALQGDHSASNLEEVTATLEAISGGYNALMKNIDLWKQWINNCEEAFNKYVINPIYSDLDAMIPLADYTDSSSPDYEDIIENHDWTNDKLEEEIAYVAKMVSDLLEEYKNMTPEDNQDMTQFITNPGFDEDKDIDFGGAEGWTIDRVSGGNVVRGPLGKGNKELMESSLGYMNYCFESWHCHKWDIWQEVENLPKGMYQLDVQGYVRCEVSGYNRGDDILPNYPSPVYLYMNSARAQFPSVYSQDKPEDKEYTTVEDWTLETINDKPYPNSMGGAAQCFGWGMYKMTTYGLVAKKGDKFRIGVKMDADQDWWCIFDSFKLTYRTPTVDVVQPILEDELKNLDLSRPMGSNVHAQASTVKVSAEDALASGDGEKMFDALVAVYDLGEAINASVELFAKLNTANENLAAKVTESKASNATKDEARALAGEISNGMESHLYEDAEVDGLLEKIQAMKIKLGMPNGYENATDDAPADFTGTIENPEYDEGTAGWSGTGAAWNSDVLDAEIFGSNYDYYQDIKGLPAGTYEVSVKAFYRAGTATVDYDTYIATPEENNNAFLYAAYINGTDTIYNSTPITRLAAEASSELEVGSATDGYVYAKAATSEEAGDGWIVPNSMVTAGYEFEAGKYANNKTIVKLDTDNATLRIGLMKNINITDNWTIFDGWTLTYYGKNSAKSASGDANAIVDITSQVAKVEFFNLNGARVNKPGKGVVLMKRTLSDGTVKVQKVTVK